MIAPDPTGPPPPHGHVDRFTFRVVRRRQLVAVFEEQRSTRGDADPGLTDGVFGECRADTPHQGMYPTNPPAAWWDTDRVDRTTGIAATQPGAVASHRRP